MKIEHLESPLKFRNIRQSFAKLLRKNSTNKNQEREGVNTSFYQLGENKIEL